MRKLCTLALPGMAIALAACGTPSWIKYPDAPEPSEVAAEIEAWRSQKPADEHLLADGFHHPLAPDCDWANRNRPCDEHFKRGCEKCPPTGQVCRGKEEKYLKLHPELDEARAPEALNDARLRLRVTRYFETVNLASRTATTKYGVGVRREAVEEIGSYYEHGGSGTLFNAGDAQAPIRDLLQENEVRYENWSVLSIQHDRIEDPEESQRRHLARVEIRRDLILKNRETGVVKEQRKLEILITWVLGDWDYRGVQWKIQGRAKP